MTFNPVATGRKIRKLRDAARMNQYDLAAELNVSHSYISKIEVGKRIGGIDIYVAIQCDRNEAGDAIRKICSFFENCIWHEKNVKTIQVHPVQLH